MEPINEIACDRSGYCKAYANPYASTRWHIGQWLVEVSHGSGPGRSYGYANLDQAESCGWSNSTGTWHIAVFDDKESANKYADEQSAYYNGSDYENR